MVRAVVDTNVIISGAIKLGIPREIWSAFKSGDCKLVLSSSMFMELSGVLQRPKFHNLIGEGGRKELLLYLELFAEVVEPTDSVTVCRDPKDNHILSCAVKAGVDFIVSGDDDLLVLKTFRGIPILKPKEFLTRLKK
jgi:putative PIN family toxin of toxin-antitoxin system